MVKFTSPFNGFRYKPIETGQSINFYVQKIVREDLSSYIIFINAIIKPLIVFGIIFLISSTFRL